MPTQLKSQLFSEYHRLSGVFVSTKKKLDRIIDLLKEYGEEVPDTSNLPDADISDLHAQIAEHLYPQNVGYREKILFTLRSLGKQCTSEDIYDFIFKHEQDKISINARDAIRSIASKMGTDGEIAVTKGGYQNIYSLKEEATA